MTPPQLLFIRKTTVMTKQELDKFILEGVSILDNELDFFKSRYNLCKFMSIQDIEDMRSDCILCLIDTIKRFDVERNFKLATFIRPRIKGFFKDYLKKENRNKILYQDFMDINIPNRIEHIKRLNKNQLDSLVSTLDLSNDKIKEIDQCLKDLDITDFSEELINGISSLDKKRLYIIVGYYFLDKDIKDIADELGFSDNSGWIYKVKRKAIKQLKERLFNDNGYCQ